MGERKILVDAFKDEDHRIRMQLDACPRLIRDRRGVDGSLSLKETLGHISFWEEFTVNFFLNKLENDSGGLVMPLDFEAISAESLAALRRLHFRDVVRGYHEATCLILNFLNDHWNDLTAQEHQKFWVPLQHRRQHRLVLESTLADLKSRFVDNANPLKV